VVRKPKLNIRTNYLISFYKKGQKTPKTQNFFSEFSVFSGKAGSGELGAGTENYNRAIFCEFCVFRG
jgi:hypothetical protein